MLSSTEIRFLNCIIHPKSLLNHLDDYTPGYQATLRHRIKKKAARMENQLILYHRAVKEDAWTGDK